MKPQGRPHALCTCLGKGRAPPQGAQLLGSAPWGKASALVPVAPGPHTGSAICKLWHLSSTLPLTPGPHQSHGNRRTGRGWLRWDISQLRGWGSSACSGWRHLVFCPTLRVLTCQKVWKRQTPGPTLWSAEALYVEVSLLPVYNWHSHFATCHVLPIPEHSPSWWF